MKNIVVVGSQWGDEGKGKIVDWLSEQADVVIRFQGGHNAGHTLVIDGVTYKLRLLPSGIVRKNKISIIGNGVVVDPWALLEEIEEIKSKGVDVNIDNFIISPFLKTSIFCFLISDSTIIFCNCLNDKIDWSLNLVIKSPDFNPALLAGETGITEPIIGTVGKGPIVSINTPLRFII